MTKKQSIFSLLLLFIFISIGAVLFFRNVPDLKGLFLLEQWKRSLFQQELAKNAETFLVKRVIDGDTIELDNGEKVRYIGINTPETVDPGRSVECFGKEASEFNKKLVEGGKVILMRDISDRDKYGRSLRFVYLEDGTFINEMLVREGYAFVATYSPDVSKQDVFRSAEKLARDEKRGLWSEATCNGKK